MESTPAVGFLDLALILLRKKKFLAIGLALVSAAAITTTLLLPKKYTSSAVLMPAQQSSSSPLTALLGGDSPVGGLLKSFDMFSHEDNSKFLTILSSRPMAEAVIEKFNLIHRYKFHKRKTYFIEDVLKAFNKNFEIGEDKLENIVITFNDKDPKFAADVVNYIVAKLDTMSFDLTRQKARGSRVFFEERLALIKHALDSVHTKLADFQKLHNMLDFEEQVKGTIEALATIESESMAADIEKAMLSSNFKADNQRIDEIAKKQRVLKARLKEYMNEGSGSLLLPLNKAPELGIAYAYLLRDVKVQEALYAFLLQMHEQAKFREANNAPVISVLEWGRVAQKKAGPKRGAICILSFFVAFCLLSGYVVVQYWFGRQREMNSEVYRKFKEIGGHLALKK